MAARAPPAPPPPLHPLRTSTARCTTCRCTSTTEQPHAVHVPPPAPFPQQVFVPPIVHDPFHLHPAALRPPFHVPVIPPAPAPAPAPPRAPVAPPRRSRRAHARRAN
ncbi:hypothetical protein NUW54_g11130 [Trametes sanguinea]|uniref:Uncharacterized protein n=1 Tax=Trametes sanguinea TaxID=158606 RepID=A0ACC1NKB6_9APHY|nr:hypothetical protein NUW54_g11130 [Trametes sanguinea]